MGVAGETARAAGAGAVETAGRPIRRAASERLTPAFLLVLFFWCVSVLEIHTFLAVHLGGGAVIKRIPTLMLLPLALLVVQRVRLPDLHWPLVLFCLLVFLLIPFAENRGLAFTGFKQILRLTLLYLGTLAVVRTPNRALFLLKFLLLSFLWFGLQGVPDGQVQWHGELANQDGFGPLMVIGMGLAYYVGLGARSRTWKHLCYGISLLCALGCVASFARGAALAGGLVLFLIWLRSPRKLATLGVGLLFVGVLVVAIERIHPEGAFWEEMKTIRHGTNVGTGLDRKRLWGVGFEVWKQSPLFGVGAYNTGVVASRTIDYGEIEGKYGNPGRLYGRALHNSYVQLLAETGLVGLGLWGMMLWSFFAWLRGLREPAARAAWHAATGGAFDLRCIAIGLELSMIAFLASSFFYNRVFMYEFYALLILAALLYQTTRMRRRPAAAPGAR